MAAQSRRPGLNVARKRLASGEVREYFYDRESGAFLGHDRIKAQAALESSRPDSHPAPGTVSALIADYLASSRFKSRASLTQRDYRHWLGVIRDEYGDLPVRGMRPGHIERIKARYEATPRKANWIIQMFRIILGRAVKLEWIEANPAAKPDLFERPPRETIWTAEDEAAFMAAARPSLRLACALLAYTAQRPSDVLAMTRGHISERDSRLWITVRQRKTSELVEMPAHHTLEPLLRERLADPAGGMLLVPSPTGRPWLRRNFARAWDEVAKASGIVGKRRQDWRRTAVVRMAEAGLTTPQIASITGHGIDYCQRIIDTYLPRRTEVAAAAIDAWEAAPAARVVNLAAAARNRAQTPVQTVGKLANRRND